ncbi:type I restriction-modification system subunit M [Mobilicoccus caccae]|uniref:site-specific DNA-methyltransferase (adenine-specific) n=1 Tax=Mobilicoccus caccae TaxID=1859295 RepID=A0ABQ6IVC1_9MICO|nr:class I SAM-dependent DNA methyltransferase [Mobilicoccus caccae]GMA41847.1 restriction endonuclease subunit M [Mobilicoccus caccae]
MPSKPDANFIWSIANLLRGPYKPKEYGDVVLPMTILRRLDCVLAATKDAVLSEQKRSGDRTAKDLLDVKLRKAAKYSFYNTSPYTLPSLTGDSANIKANLLSYVDGFSDNVRDVFTRFGFEEQVQRLEEANALYLVVQEFAKLDLRPQHVSNTEMGSVFEELIRKFAEASNETAGEHFTPREVIALMVDLLLVGDEDATTPGKAVNRRVYDPAAGTGGMLSTMDEHLREQNPAARLLMAGQEINPSSYAVCKADMIIKGQPVDAIALGNTLTDDAHAGKDFHYCLSNPPFGVEWKTSQREVIKEHKQLGFNGRFGPGLPAVSDGSMLFLLHLIDKMRTVDPDDENVRGRAAIVLNGSPLFTGRAGSGESEIRRWVIESDLLDAIIALPTDVFYNTGIATYIWVLDRKKPAERRGYVQLIDGSQMFTKMRKSLGSKRKELLPADIETLVKLYAEFDGADDKRSKVFPGEAFGFHTITVERSLRLAFQATAERIDEAITSKAVQKLDESTQEQLRRALQTLDRETVWRARPAFDQALGKALGAAGLQVGSPVRKAIHAALSERDETAEICTDAKGNPEPDPKLRDTENVPLGQDVDEYVAREVLPYVPDAWIDHAKTKVGYEIPFTRHFYEYVPPRTLEEIDADVKRLIAEIQELFAELDS